MTSTVEISVQKAIDPYLKIENLGRGGENAMTTTLIFNLFQLNKWIFLNEMNVQWMFAEHSREQSRENECSWMIKNVRKIPLAFSHIVLVK